MHVATTTHTSKTKYKKKVKQVIELMESSGLLNDPWFHLTLNNAKNGILFLHNSCVVYICKHPFMLQHGENNFR